MKKSILIFLLCLFAGVTKSYAVLWDNEIGPGPNFHFEPEDNQQVVYPYMEGMINGAFTMNAYMWPQQYNTDYGTSDYDILDYGCILSVVNIENYPMITYGSPIIYGPYNGTEYADAPSFQSITVSDTSIARIYIQTHFCGGYVWFEW